MEYSEKLRLAIEKLENKKRTKKEDMMLHTMRDFYRTKRFSDKKGL